MRNPGMKDRESARKPREMTMMMKYREISSLCVSGDLCTPSSVLLWFVDHGATSLHSLSSKSLSCSRCSTVNNHFWRRSKRRLINFSWLLLFSLSKFNLLFATSEGLMMMIENTDKEFFRVWARSTIGKSSSFGMCKISCSIYNLSNCFGAKNALQHVKMSHVLSDVKHRCLLDSVKWNSLHED